MIPYLPYLDRRNSRSFVFHVSILFFYFSPSPIRSGVLRRPRRLFMAEGNFAFGNNKWNQYDMRPDTRSTFCGKGQLQNLTQHPVSIRSRFVLPSFCCYLSIVRCQNQALLTVKLVQGECTLIVISR